MNTRTTNSSGTAEVKRREKKDEGGRSQVEPAVQPVTYIEGRCTCCPYGYHIDLDFLNFCKTITDGSALSNLKRIQRTKRKLRKSMEVMLQQQQGSSSGDSLPPTPDVVHSTEASRLINMVHYEQSATHQVLHDIDSSVNATLASIDSLQQSSGPSHSLRYASTDSEDAFTYSPITPLSAVSLSSQQQYPFGSFPAEPPPPPPRKSSLRYAHSSGDESPHSTAQAASGRRDSVSSSSSVSTVSSEQVVGHRTNSFTTQGMEPASTQTRPQWDPRQAASVSSETLATTMASHFPQQKADGSESPSSPMSPNTTISKASLAALREAMSVSLQRLRDLEEQVKAIPILQVRISVLKEEKRLLALQLKAKSGGAKPNTRSVGIGEGIADSPCSPSLRAHVYSSASSSGAPPTVPKPSRVRSVGVGVHSVVEPYLLQPDLPVGYTITDHQVQSEVLTNIQEKKSALLLGSSFKHQLPNINLVPDSNSSSSLSTAVSPLTKSPSMPPAPTHFTINQIQRSDLRPLTRTIGVGDGDVHEVVPKILEKESSGPAVGGERDSAEKRSIGVEAKVQSQSVGVSYSYVEPQPATRTIGVNVSSDSSSVLTPMDSERQAELHKALHSVLHRETRSVGTNCHFRPITLEAGVQHDTLQVTVGSGDDKTDADQPVSQQTVGVMVKPDMSSVLVSVDREWQENATNTEVRETESRACNTDGVEVSAMCTNTEQLDLTALGTQTDVRVFHDMKAVIHTGANTTRVDTTTSSSNTTTPTINHTGVNTTVLENTQTPSTPKTSADKAVNTPDKSAQLSMSKVEYVEVAAEAPKRPLTRQEQIIQRGANQAFAFLGSTSSSGSLSPTSPKGLFSIPGEESVTESEARLTHSSPALQVTESKQPGEVLDVSEDVKESESFTMESGEKSVHAGVEMEKDSSVQVPASEQSTQEDEMALGESAADQVSSRLTRHRHSDGGRISQELLQNMQGAFSGRRTGSVEDFMPDDMRRLMNIDTASSSSSGKLRIEGTVVKTTRTITTKKTSHGEHSTVSVTKTVTDQDGSMTTTTTSHDPEEEEVIPERKFLGKLSSGQMDLSQIGSDDDSLEDASADTPSSMESSECGGIKDSGYEDDSVSSAAVVESSDSQGTEASAVGRAECKVLKSIMKHSKTDDGSPKRGITFADSVVGGTGSSSEEEATESDEDSTTSFEEGSYDGREGDITYECQDDEAIAQGLPGAKMYDQNIRETYELSKEMQEACEVIANYLVDSTTIQTKQLNTNLSLVKEEWFQVSSHKLSSVYQVEDYLSSVNEISSRLMEYIVNLVDTNGNAAIHYCVSHGNFDIVGLLLDTEVCDVQRPNKAGYTPAMLASLAYVQNEEHREFIRTLFEVSDINAQAEQTGQTALMLATSQCRTDMVELLLEAEADCNIQDMDGSTALMGACEHGHTAIVQLLLAQPDCDANLKDNENSTALSIAMEAGHKDIGVILYKHLNFSKPTSPGFQKKRKGSSSPTPRQLVK